MIEKTYNHIGKQKKGHISLGDQQPIIYKFFKDFQQQTFLNTGTTDETFQQSRKQDSFRHLLKSSVSMQESSGSQFFRTTTEIQSGPDAFDKSTFLMTFLIILGVTEILCSFRLVLDWKTGSKEIPESSRLEFLEKLSAKYSALSDAEENTSGLLNRGDIADLPLLKTLLAIR